MRHPALRSLAAPLALFLAGLASATAGTGPEQPPASPAVSFQTLKGWQEDDHAAALATFVRSCRKAAGPLVAPCREAVRLGDADRRTVRLFFERWFQPVEIDPLGFLTGYFEPEVAGSLRSAPGYRVPLLGRPSDLVALSPGETPADWPAGMTAARRTASGLEAYPDRAAIEEGALGQSARPIVYLSDPVDAFMVHVQGSARVRLPSGSTVRVGFDGRNGHPYTAIARVLAEQEDVPPSSMTADRLVAWLKAHPERAPEVMRANRSYIFFRRVPSSDMTAGPVGAAGVPLTAGRSLAVDRTAWTYGTPIWLAGELPLPDGRTEAFHRLVVAQDTGAAIVGPARGDLFVGSGPEAGAQAALMRQRVRWVVLKARSRPDP